ncbi:complex I subunit 5 family protein [Inediibacterium massiliense]|uniref:complex I subunit 5 family protein n=1 Tax=Inediibacterium massiliense TaxID=1658111 RepID=UPI0006B55C79|nr:complex I subunit 5 family protein [Inediibacterium massiliense]
MNQVILLSILLFPAIISLIGYLVGKKSEKIRDILHIGLTGITFLIVTFLYKEVVKEPITVFIPDIMGTGLSLKLDVFRYIFLWISCLIWFLTTIYSTQYLIRHKNRNRYYAFFMLTLFSTIGIFLSENILNLFTFFEIMSFTSYMLIIHDEDQYTLQAGKVYIGMAIGGGMVLLMGLFLLYEYTGVLYISQLGEAMRDIGNIKYMISTLIFIGFGVKATVFPFHVWVPKVYPAAPTPASAILSGVLLKTGIFGIFIINYYLMEGDMNFSIFILILGLINMFVGGFFALFQRNIKRILAYSGMSQAGYILVGIGLIGILREHGSVAIYATLFHIVNHAIFKVLLFMGAGIIYMILHELSINEIKGFGKHKYILKGLFFLGFLAIIGFPGSNGYISKTLLHIALAEAHHLYHNIGWTVAEVIFTISSVFTVAYMLKIFVTVFIENNEKYKGQWRSFIKKRALFPMLILSILIIYIGINPQNMMNIIGYATDELGEGHFSIQHFYTWSHMKSSLINIVLGIILYLLTKKYLTKEIEGKIVYMNPTLNWLSIEKNIYKPTLRWIFISSSYVFHVIDQSALNLVYYMGGKIKRLSGIELSKGNKNISIDIPTKTVSQVVSHMYEGMNSLMYALFIVAVILAILLMVLVF